MNYSKDKDVELAPYHGKAIALDINDRYAPFPSLFIIHEMRVRGFHPFDFINPSIPSSIAWQDWVTTSEVLNTSGSFIRESPPWTRTGSTPPPQFQPMASAMSGGKSESGVSRLAPLDNNLINQILEATYAMPSWKACMIEGTSWDGTAEENIKKYVSDIGVSDD